METTLKQISKNRVKISVTISAVDMEAYFESHYEKLAPTVNLPGFRPGKAPRVMTIEAIGQARIANMALEEAIDEAYRNSLNEHKKYPVTAPAISISKHPQFEGNGEQNELKFDVEFDILPEAKVGDYKKIKVKPIDPKALIVNDEEVDKVVDYLRRQSSDLKQVDRAAKMGDWLDLSFEGSVKGVKKDKLTSPAMPIVLGETKLVPGFEEQIVGMKKAETKTFKVKFPKDFADKEFANTEVEFSVTVTDVREINLPEMDAKFFEKFGLKNIKELKTNIKASLEGEKTEQQRQTQVAEISEQIIKMTRVDIPKSLIDNEKSRMKQMLSEDLMKQGSTIEKYMESLKITDKKFEEDLHTQAERNILLGVGIGEIARKENIEINSQEGTKRVFDFLAENSK
jgi:trigger factor